MLGKRTQPLIGKISELLVSGGRAAALLDTIGSPRSPFEMNLKSPNNKGQKSYDLGGVGLGIVVALDEKKESCCEVLPKHALNNRSRAITIEHTNKNGFENSEDYTFVTYHVPNKTITKVYYDAGEGLIQSKINTASVHRTIQKPTQTFFEFEDETSSFPTSDFLSSCHMCRKNLHGKDIYMYRGEKAFCSTECRSKQIMMDERKERCRSEASRSNKELSTSPYTRDQMFSTGILAL